MPRRLHRVRGRLSHRGDHAAAEAARRARSGPLHLLRRVRQGVSDRGHHANRRPSHGGAPPRRPPAGRAGQGTVAPGSGAGRKAAPAFRALAEVAAGERRRLQRLRGRHERARHHRLGSRPVRHPVRRLAAPCRRPAHHRPRLEEHGTGAQENLRRRARAKDRHRGGGLCDRRRPVCRSPASPQWRWRVGARGPIHSRLSAPSADHSRRAAPITGAAGRRRSEKAKCT